MRHCPADVVLVCVSDSMQETRSHCRITPVSAATSPQFRPICRHSTLLTALIAIVLCNSGIVVAGLGKGGQQIQSCRKAYISAIQLLVQLANLQTAFITLDTALKVTNRRVNALENVVKPKIENTISYIKVCVAWRWP